MHSWVLFCGSALIAFGIGGIVFFAQTIPPRLQSAKPEDHLKPALPIETPKLQAPSVDQECARGFGYCLSAISDRTVRVMSFDSKYRVVSGTGTIFSAKDDSAIIFTSAHVVTSGRRWKMRLNPDIWITSDKGLTNVTPEKVCAFRYEGVTKDVAVLQVKNTWSKEYPSLRRARRSVYQGETVHFVSHRGNTSEAFSTSFNGFKEREGEVILGGAARHGDSGSAVFTSDGFLIGVLSQFASIDRAYWGYFGYQQIPGFSSTAPGLTLASDSAPLVDLFDTTLDGFKLLYENEKNRGVKYICEEYFSLPETKVSKADALR